MVGYVERAIESVKFVAREIGLRFRRSLIAEARQADSRLLCPVCVCRFVCLPCLSDVCAPRAR